MSFGKLPGLPAMPAPPKVPTEATQTLSTGPASTSVGAGLPQHFDPSNPSVQVSGTIHNPTGVGGDLTVSREVKIPTEAPNVNLGMPSMPSMGSASDLAPDVPSSGGGFGMPSIGNPLSGLSMPDMPSLGNPFSGFSAPSLPSGALLPTLPSIGTPGMPGFRFLDLPSFTAPDLDMSPIDLVMPDWPFEWSDPIDNSIDPDHVVTSDDPLWVKLHLVSEDGADIPDVPFLVSACEDKKLEGTLDASGTKDLEVPEGEAYIAFPDLESVTRKCFANQLRHALEVKDLSKTASLLVSGATRLEEITKDFKKRFGKDLKSEFSNCWTGSGFGSGGELLWEAVASKVIGAGDALAPLQAIASKPDASVSEAFIASIPVGTVYQASTPVAFFLDDSWGTAKEAPAAQWLAIRLDSTSKSAASAIAHTWSGSVFGPVRLEVGFWVIVAQSTAKKEIVGQTIQVVDRLDASNANDLAQLVRSVGEVAKVIERTHQIAEVVGDASEESDNAEEKGKVHKDQLSQYGQALKPLWETLASHQGIQSVTATRFHGLASEPLCVFLSQEGTKWVVTDWTNPGVPGLSGQFASNAGNRPAGEDPFEAEKLIKQAFAKWASSARYSGDAISWRVPLLNVDITSTKGPGLYFLSGCFSLSGSTAPSNEHVAIEDLLSGVLHLNRQASSLLQLHSAQEPGGHQTKPYPWEPEAVFRKLIAGTTGSIGATATVKGWLGLAPEKLTLPGVAHYYASDWSEEDDDLCVFAFSQELKQRIQHVLKQSAHTRYEKSHFLLHLVEGAISSEIVIARIPEPKKAEAEGLFESNPKPVHLFHTSIASSNTSDWSVRASLSTRILLSKKIQGKVKKEANPATNCSGDVSGRCAIDE